MSVSLKHFALGAQAKPSLAQRVSAWLATAWQAERTRRSLATLDDRALADIGVSRAEAQFLAEQPVWQASLLR